jgi:hypothetical protein
VFVKPFGDAEILNSNYAPGRRGFKFIVPLNVLMPEWCTRVCITWKTRDVYVAGRPALKD